VSVCLSVREDITETTRAIFSKFLVHVADPRSWLDRPPAKWAKSAIYDYFVGIVVQLDIF